MTIFTPIPSYDDARNYTIQITASQFLVKTDDLSASITRGCNCEFAAISNGTS